nr:SMI1/KNR4 family protein [Bacteroidota bacterium]
MGIDKQNFWDENYYKHPPLTAPMLAMAEQSLNVKLPPLYIELLYIQNGGYTKDYLFPMNVKTSWSENHVPLRELFGIVTDKNISSAQNILDTPYLVSEWELPEKQILINGGGSWWITLDYRAGDIPTVRWIDVDYNEDIHIANSFEEFIDGLVLRNGNK